MIRLIKKWLVLRRLRRENINNIIGQDATTLSHNLKSAVAWSAFVYKISIEQLNKRHQFKLADSASQKEMLNATILEFNTLIDSCIRDNLIHKEAEHAYSELTNEQITGQPFIRTTDLGDDFCGLLPLMQKILKDYNLVWTMVIFPFIAGVYGSVIVRELLKHIWQLFTKN